jgi:hypothetical protein
LNRSYTACARGTKTSPWASRGPTGGKQNHALGRRTSDARSP